MKTFDLKKYGSTWPIQLKISVYLYGGGLAIQMISHEDGIAEPWSYLTVNLDAIPPLNCAFIDTNGNGEDILEWIAQHNLAVPTGRYEYSGYCKYPEYRFEEALLRELDPIGYEGYLHDRKELAKEDNKEKTLDTEAA